MRLPGASLPVCEHAHVVAVDRRGHQGLRVGEDVGLRGRRGEDGVEAVLLQRKGSAIATAAAADVAAAAAVVLSSSSSSSSSIAAAAAARRCSWFVLEKKKGMRRFGSEGKRGEKDELFFL